MEAQYYTPTIDEFHVGFECQRNVNGMWENYVCQKSNDRDYGTGLVTLPFDPELNVNYESVRVKHLDRQDIEECGWEMEKILVLDDDENDTYSDGFVKRIGNDVWFELVELGKFNFYIQKKWYRNSVTQMCRSVFYGNIRNKSELKKLMQMLNIK